MGYLYINVKARVVFFCCPIFLQVDSVEKGGKKVWRCKGVYTHHTSHTHTHMWYDEMLEKQVCFFVVRKKDKAVWAVF